MRAHTVTNVPLLMASHNSNNVQIGKNRTNYVKATSLKESAIMESAVDFGMTRC